MSLIRTSQFVRDTEGNLWQEAGVNEFQQRLLKCIEGARQGDTMLDPRLDRPEGEVENAPLGRALSYEEEFYRDLYSKPFWEQ